MYITKQEMIDRYGEREMMQVVRNINGNNDNASDAIELAIKDACMEIDGYVARQYPLPLAVVSGSLKRAVAVIARYYLWKDKASEQIRQDYEDAIRWLDKVASGKVYLVFDDDGGQAGTMTEFVSGAFVI